MTDRSSGFIVAVVDDDQSVLRSLEYLLESADYAARLFTSAMALLESGGLNEVDCLISDIDMPGMDGVDLVERIARGSSPCAALSPCLSIRTRIHRDDVQGRQKMTTDTSGTGPRASVKASPVILSRR